MIPKTISVLTLIILSFYVSSQIIPSARLTDWSGAGARATFYDTTVNILTFGADSSGVNDNTLFLDSAINGLPNGGTIYFPAGTYLFNSTQHIPGGIRIKGTGTTTVFNFNCGGAGDMFLVGGTVLSGFDTLVSGYTKDSKELTVQNASQYQPNTYLRLTENHNGRMFSSWAYNALGQIFKIDSVDTTNNKLIIDQPLRQTYQANLSPKLRKLIMTENVGFECFKMNRLDATTAQTANINFTYAANCYAKGVESYLTNFSHIKIQNSTNITVTGSFFKNGHNYGSGGKAYGVTMQATSGYNLVENNVFEHLRHSVLLQSSANGNVISYNYSFNPFWTGVFLPPSSAGDLVLHGNYPYMNLFEGNICQNIVVDNSHGINGPYNTFFRNRAEKYGLFMNNNPASNSQHYIANEIIDPSLGFYYLQGTNHITYGNNNKGTIEPAGTDTLSRKSYYLTNMPVYWSVKDLWPTIGIENRVNTYINPAYDRFQNGVLAQCSEDTVTHKLTICPSQNFSFNGTVYANSGMFLDSVVTVSGEKQYIKLILGIASKPQITNQNTYLTATQSYDYAWYINDTLTDSTNQTIQITKNGYYTVLVTDSIGCTQYSDSLLVQSAGINKLLAQTVQIYPNPTLGTLNITQPNYKYNKFEVIDVSGKTQISGNIQKNKIAITLSNLSKGVYWLKLYTPNKTETCFLKKIVLANR